MKYRLFSLIFSFSFLYLSQPAFCANGPTPVSASSTALSEQESAKIRGEAKQAVQDEIEVFNSFEIDHPETDELLELLLSDVQSTITALADGTYIVKGNFKDKGGAAYVVDLYMEKVEGESYELVDAILTEAGGKPVKSEDEISS